jgi:hypothetical protein
MSHVRKQIKDALKALLDANTLFEGQVHLDRDTEFDPTELPAVSIHNINAKEVNRPLTVSRPRLIERTCEFFVDVLAQHLNRSLNATDELAAEVEKTLLPNPNPLVGTLIKDIVLAESQILQSSEVNAQIGVVRMKFLVTYHAREGQPETAI